MTDQLPRVNPGDRITADYINALVDRVNALAAAGTGTTPPPGNAPQISGFVPATQVAIGGELDVLGSNFAVPANQNVVELAGTPVTGFLAGCSDTLLRLAVPAIPGVPTDADLTVQTTHGTAQRSIHVVAAAAPVPVGKPVITDATGTLGTINAGSSYTFRFTVDAEAVSMTETYVPDAVYTNTAPASVPASAWDTATTIGGLDPNGQISVVPGTPKTITVTVTIPATATQADLSLSLRSVHGDPGSSASSAAVPIRVGSAPPPSDARIRLAIGQIGSAAQFRAVQINGMPGIEVRYPASGSTRLANLPINVGYDVAGTYHYDATIESPNTAMWTVGAATPNDVAYTAGDAQIHVPLTLVATSPTDASKVLVVVARRTNSDAVGQISNYLRIPIRGFV